jgi:hypothetical protein
MSKDSRTDAVKAAKRLHQIYKGIFDLNKEQPGPFQQGNSGATRIHSRRQLLFVLYLACRAAAGV